MFPVYEAIQLNHSNFCPAIFSLSSWSFFIILPYLVFSSFSYAGDLSAWTSPVVDNLDVR